MPKQRTAPPGPADSDLATASNAPAEGVVTVEQRIGRVIKHLRTRVGLTMARLARAAGISASMMSKIETGQISPSLGTLEAIARVLNVSLAAIFTRSEEQRDCSFVKARHGVQIDRHGTKAGHRYELLGHRLEGAIAVEPYLITLTRDAKPYTAFQHAGMELMYMLTGRVSYRHGDEVYYMEPGDTLFFDATAHHGPETLHDLPATYLTVIIYPRG